MLQARDVNQLFCALIFRNRRPGDLQYVMRGCYWLSEVKTFQNKKR